MNASSIKPKVLTYAGLIHYAYKRNSLKLYRLLAQHSFTK